MLKRSKCAGVSLVELMIAIAVIVIGMSGVAASLYFGFAKSNHGDDIATATQYSRMLIEIGSGRSFVDLNVDSTGLPSAASGMNDSAAQPPRPLDDPPYHRDDFLAYPYATEGGDEPSRDLQRYKRKIQIARLGARGTEKEFLARMTVTLYWEEKGVKKNVTTATIVPISTKAP